MKTNSQYTITIIIFFRVMTEFCPSFQNFIPLYVGDGGETNTTPLSMLQDVLLNKNERKKSKLTVEWEERDESRKWRVLIDIWEIDAKTAPKFNGAVENSTFLLISSTRTRESTQLISTLHASDLPPRRIPRRRPMALRRASRPQYCSVLATA